MTSSSTPTTNTADREIVTTRILNAPRELVFKVWTDPAHVANWWGPRGFRNTTSHIDIRTGGSWRFTMHAPDGTDFLNHIRYEKVDAPERLLYRHTGDGDTADIQFYSEVTFEALGDKTRVTLRAVFPTPEARNHVVEKFGAVQGAQDHISRLEEYVTHFSPQTFTLTRTFDAPRALVFKAWTEPARLAQWFGPKGFKVTQKAADFRPGGILHHSMEAPNGMVIWAKWLIRDIITPHRLVFVSCFSDEAGGLGRHPMAPAWPQQTLSTILFTEEAGKTTITMHGTPIEATPAETALFADNHESMRGGWGGTMEQLIAFLASPEGQAP